MAEVDEVQLEGELVAEEDVDPAERADEVRPLPHRYRGERDSLPALKDEVKTAAIAVAGGALAGAATVAAVRVVASAGSKRRSPRRMRRRDRPGNIVASRSFLVDVHVLGR